MEDDRNVHQDELLASFGYRPELKRVMGRLTAFAASFSGISITAGILLILPFLLTDAGPAGMWTWPIGAGGALLTALVFADIAGRIPVAGYAYQWGSRLLSPTIGWLLALGGLIGFMMGATGGPLGIAPFWLSEFGISVTTGSSVIAAAVIVVGLAVINIIGTKVATRVNTFAVVAEIVSGIVIAIGLLITAIINHPHSASFFVQKQPGESGSYVVPFLLAFLMAAFTLTVWEIPADMAEETKDATTIAPRAMIQSVGLSGLVGMLLLVSLIYAAPGINSVVNSSTPILTIVDYQWGRTLGEIANVFFLIAITASALVVQAGAARLLFSLARDNMLPGSRFIRRVAPKARTPLGALITVAVFAIAVFALGTYFFSTVLGYLFGATAVGFALIYAAVSAVFIYKVHTRSMPEQHGSFSLKKWALPVGWAALLWQLFLVGTLTVPKANRAVGITTVVLIALGVLWYVVYLRRAIRAGKAGPRATATGRTSDVAGAVSSAPAAAPEVPDGASEAEPAVGSGNVDSVTRPQDTGV